MTISNLIMDVYEKAIREKNHKLRQDTRDLLVYIANRTSKDFSELSEDELCLYIKELIASDTVCNEYSGVDEEENYHKCKQLYECFARG